MLSRRQDPPCPSGKLYWTCISTPQEFHGCCVGNPCHNSGICPDDPNHLSTSALSMLTTATRTISNINTPTTTAWFASSTGNPTSAPAPTATPVAAIVGGAVGGFFFILAIGCVWLFVLHRRGKQPSGAGKSEHVPLKLAHSRNSSVDTSQYSPQPQPLVSSWQKQGHLSPLPSPYLDSPEMAAGSMHKRSYSNTSSVPSPYLQQQEESQEIVYSELPAACVDPVELAGDPLMPQPQPQSLGRRREWSEAHQRDWDEQRFGRSLDGGTHAQQLYDRPDASEDEDDAMGWRDDGRGRRQ
ncbi:hypothetical protein BZA05DRAFT_403925 [Tricharina praecox]|uniref:uncharacterized protein n=1 Tax=Tricharina praecox TaxID=43433 RepID=UPI00221FAD73|nr:uncharacterized protein BZA05DRAFT_403925 [Tricharina praecox]KAI5848385.1 hypothetical protein BZA05DRAFT_403925 [Tricharina praecox]